MKKAVMTMLALVIVSTSVLAQQYSSDQQFTYVVPNTNGSVEARVTVNYSEIFDYVVSIQYVFRSLTDATYEIEYGGAYLRNADQPRIGSTVVANPGSRWSLGSFRFSSNDSAGAASVTVDSPIFRVSRR